MKSTRFLFFTILLAAQTLLAQSPINEQYLLQVPEHLTKISETQRLGRSNITFLKDNAGKEYVLKQRKNPDDDASIKDTLAPYLAEAAVANIPINKVALIPAEQHIPGKKRNDIPATLHTRMPGKVIGAHDSETINRFYSPEFIINQPDLIKLAALDLFVNNCDRHEENVLKKGNRFYGIDMDWIYTDIQLHPLKYLVNYMSGYTVTMPRRVASDIQRLWNNNSISQKKKYSALKQLYATLNKLVAAHTPNSIYNLWMAFAQKGHHNYSFFKKRIIKMEIYRNYHLVKKLLSKIKKILETQPQTIKIEL